MDIEYDRSKDELNQLKHGVSLDVAGFFDWDTALIEPDERADYNEDRFVAYGFIDTRIYCLVYTKRSDVVRVISLLKANKREVKEYAEKT